MPAGCTLMGMPVQWKPKGNRAFLPWVRSKPAANSALESEKACPRCRRPFMYGYGNVTRYFSWPSSPASTSKTLASLHRACILTSISLRASRLNVLPSLDRLTAVAFDGFVSLMIMTRLPRQPLRDYLRARGERGATRSGALREAEPS